MVLTSAFSHEQTFTDHRMNHHFGISMPLGRRHPRHQKRPLGGAELLVNLHVFCYALMSEPTKGGHHD